jgi:glutathione S-transferase
MAELFAIHYSPWSECARWALSHHGVPFREVAYTPMVSEPRLRARLRRLRGRVTVPAFFDEHGAFTDSFDIARHAETHGSGRSLFPDGADPAIARWNDRIMEALHAGRALVTARVSGDLAARNEAVPRVLRRTPLARPLGAVGVSYLVRKYELTAPKEAAHRDRIRGVLEELRAALGGGDHLVAGQLTYADVLGAAMMQVVVPVDDRFIRIGPATRAAWTDPELAAAYPDLVAWRDRIYDRYR